jgi:hypothetical protein
VLFLMDTYFGPHDYKVGKVSIKLEQ